MAENKSLFIGIPALMDLLLIDSYTNLEECKPVLAFTYSESVCLCSPAVTGDIAISRFVSICNDREGIFLDLGAATSGTKPAC